jgi:GR25 family glycosyltransferase involved in LPS biosynthesis
MTDSENIGIFIQVINLLRRPDRLDVITADFRKAGLTFETQIAVDGQSANFHSEYLSNGEIGCFKSHINAMRRQIEVGAPYSLIVEDDVKLSPVVDQSYLLKMTQLMERNRLDMLQIGFTKWLYLPSLRAGVLEFLIAFLKGRGTMDRSGTRFVLGEFRAGTFAYIVNKRIADAISEAVPSPPLIPLDGYFSSLAQGQVGRGDLRIARLVTSVASHPVSRDDSDVNI